MLTVIVTKMKITGRSICGVISYCDNNENNGVGGRYIWSANSYSGNNGEVYMQC